MLEKLRNKEIGTTTDHKSNGIDVAIGLTEGWVAGIARGEPVRIIGSYVKSPLRIIPAIYIFVNLGWAISTGPDSKYNDISDLRGSSIAVSRIGRFILAEIVIYF
jgi:hypothetical protein